MKASEIFEAVANLYQEKTGFNCVIEPQKVNDSAPHFRLSFSGSGDDTGLFNGTGMLYASGEGPKVFVDSVSVLSAKTNDLRGRRHHIQTPEGFIDVIFRRTGSGGYENKDENNSAYVYTEYYEVKIETNITITV